MFALVRNTIAVSLLMVLGTFRLTAATRQHPSAPPKQPSQVCGAYDQYFQEASQRFGVPVELIKAIAWTESTCNPSASGGGMMQLGDLVSVGNLICDANPDHVEHDPEANILAGTAFLAKVKSCVAGPQSAKSCQQAKSMEPSVEAAVDIEATCTPANDYNLCSSLSPAQKTILHQNVESWWFAVAYYNGGGADNFLFTANYPYRVWHSLELLGGHPKYPPHARSDYLCGENGTTSATKLLKGVPYCVEWCVNLNTPATNHCDVFFRSDDSLCPKPVSFGKQPCDGIRWVDPDFNPFTDFTEDNSQNVCEAVPGPAPQPPGVTAVQLLADGVTSLPEGGTTTGGSVILAVQPTSSVAGPITVDIEIHPTREAFNGSVVDTKTSNSGEWARFPRMSLVSDSYHWRYRATNTQGTTGWVEYGAAGNTDFVVTSPPLPTITVAALLPEVQFILGTTYSQANSGAFQAFGGTPP